jgi:hypothetical protein
VVGQTPDHNSTALAAVALASGEILIKLANKVEKGKNIKHFYFISFRIIRAVIICLQHLPEKKVA